MFEAAFHRLQICSPMLQCAHALLLKRSSLEHIYSGMGVCWWAAEIGIDLGEVPMHAGSWGSSELCTNRIYLAFAVSKNCLVDLARKSASIAWYSFQKCIKNIIPKFFLYGQVL